jgi:hypothetical protein
MKYILLLPFLIQGVLMLIDEFYFHRRRGLGPWERVGHPVDTLSVILVYGLMLVWPPTEGAVAVAAALSVFSCLLVTKDEFVHSKECEPLENWIHALLFVLHPLVLISAFLLWPLRHLSELPADWQWLEGFRGLEWHLLNLLFASLAMFVVQNAIWNLRPAKEAK